MSYDDLGDLLARVLQVADTTVVDAFVILDELGIQIIETHEGSIDLSL